MVSNTIMIVSRDSSECQNVRLPDAPTPRRGVSFDLSVSRRTVSRYPADPSGREVLLRSSSSAVHLSGSGGKRRHPRARTAPPHLEILPWNPLCALENLVASGDRLRRRRPASRRVLVERLLTQPTYPEMLGLRVERREDWFPWLIAATLFAKPISADIARRTIRLLLSKQVTTPEAVVECGWEGLVAILDAGGYVRYDFSTADRLLTIAAALPRDRLQVLVTRASSSKEIGERLTAIKGIGPKTVSIFLRELRGVLRMDPPVSPEATKSASRLGIRLKGARLSRGDLSRLESILVRTWIEHCRRERWQTCPAAEFCGCAPKESRARATLRS